MSINATELGGQLADEIYNRLLNTIRSELSTSHAPRRCDWRFHPPERDPETEQRLRAYWRSVYHHELAAMEVEWAEPRPITITADSSTEGDHVSIQQAS